MNSDSWRYVATFCLSATCILNPTKFMAAEAAPQEAVVTAHVYSSTLGGIRNMGWFFRPKVRLMIASAGTSQQPEVSVIRFWQGTSNVLARLSIPARTDAYFPAPQLVLEPDQVYGISNEQYTPGMAPIVGVYNFENLSPGPSPDPFSVSPYLEYLGIYTLTGTTWTREPADTNLFMRGPNFKFWVVPSINLTATKTNTLVVTWSTPVSDDKLGVQVADTLSGEWKTPQNVLPHSADGKEIIVPLPGKDQFFKLVPSSD